MSHMAVPKSSLVWLASLLLAFAVSADAAEKPQVWREVQSPHFTVATNGNEKHARRIAYQFEAIRAVMHRTFPRLRVDTAAPIIVLVTDGEKNFQALEPEEWSRKGQMKRAGLFQRGPEKNYVLMWGDAPGDDPYSIIYHEYTHLLTNQSERAIPLWLDEGLAEFYGHSEIKEKEVGLGRASPDDIYLLRQTKLLPLATLFAVNHSSPYYNEEHKGSVFYAESWALTHYLMTQRPGETRNQVSEFFDLLNQQVDSLTAAQRAFGDLGKLQKDLDKYVQQMAFPYFRVKGATEVDESAFTARALSPAESAALRGDFSAYLQQYSRARTLLQEALREDPNCAPAFESLGYVELQQRHLEDAKKWFSQAVKLNSGSYLAHYYFAVMTMQEGQEAATSPEVEASLHATMRLNPSFAPAYSSLANLYMMRNENLEEAHRLALLAVQLDPGNFGYVYNTALLLLRMKQADNAVRVAERALGLAKSDSERSAVLAFLDNAHQFQQYESMQKEQEKRRLAEEKDLDQLRAQSSKLAQENAQKARDMSQSSSQAAPAGMPPSATAEGKIVEVSCTRSGSMTLTVALRSYKLDLHTQNYKQIEVRIGATKLTSSGDACGKLQGVNARVAYALGARAGEILSIEVLK